MLGVLVRFRRAGSEVAAQVLVCNPVSIAPRPPCQPNSQFVEQPLFSTSHRQSSILHPFDERGDDDPYELWPRPKTGHHSHDESVRPRSEISVFGRILRKARGFVTPKARV